VNVHPWWHRLVKSGHQPRQNHDLTAHWSGVVEEEGSLSVEMLQMSWGSLKAPSTESQSIPSWSWG
jgi:hypothetical protein